MKDLFNGSVLYISARSPFARRVRLAFLEHGIQFETKVFDVFKPAPELVEVNPLARVPALRLLSGEALVDSHLILDLFYRTVESPLAPASESDRLLCAYWSGIATGLAEKIVEFFIEKTRPEPKRDGEVLEEFTAIRDRVLGRLERLLSDSGRPHLADRLTQADLDLGAALAYLSLRDSPEWKTRFPAAGAYLDRLEARPSFAATRPPAA